MRVNIDISENKVFARAYRRGCEEGFTEGLQEKGRPLLRRMMEKRFGVLPDWADQQFAQLSRPDLLDFGVRLLDAKTLEELFG